MDEHVIRCANCGTLWAAEFAPSGQSTLRELTCPVCHFSMAENQVSLTTIDSVTDLEAKLDTLVRSAWASGLDTEMIVHVLRDELAFAAEMSHVGRRFTVQLIDLGPQDNEIVQRPVRDRRDLLTSRRGSA